jgi:nicotinamide-nucleotide amidase
MKAEIIAIGTELLIGDVVNTNATWLSKELAAIGVDVYFHQTVGDNVRRIHEVVQLALSRSDVLIFTGGLGPTDDDLTVSALAEYFKAPLVADPESEETIRNYFIARDMPMSKLNLKQALKPTDAITIKNPVGTAPGILWDVSGRVGKAALMMTFPGVPKELYAMWPQGREAIVAKMREIGEEPAVLATKFLHFFGVGESKLGELLRDLMQAETPTVAPYVGQAEVRIRVAAKGKTEAEAQQLIEPVRQEILKRCGQYYFGEDGATLEDAVGKLLTDQQRTVSVAESCTGGLVSSRLTDVPGSSNYVHLNLVTYSNHQKSELLGVDPNLFQTVGAVSEEVARQMAQGVRQVSGASVGVSLTGIAGPTGDTPDKPVGLVYIGLAGLGETIVKRVLVNRNYGRRDIKFWFSQYALHYLHLYLQGRLMPDEVPTEAAATASTG